MHLLKMVGVTLGLLPALALVPGVPKVELTGYKAKLHMQMWANFSREEKEKEWAEAQPCVRYEQKAEEEAEEDIPGTRGDIIHDQSEEVPGQSVETVIQDGENTPVAAEEQSSATPLFQVDGYVPDAGLQEYLYNRLAEHGIEWFMPYAVCLIAQESSWNPLAENGNGLDKGLLQYRISLVPWMDWRNPYQEIDYFVSQMSNRANNLGCTVSDMISRHNVSDFCPYNQSYVDAVMSHSGSLVKVR